MRPARIYDSPLWLRKTLTEKIRATYERAANDPGYTTFLKHFEIKAAKLDTREFGGQELILGELKGLRDSGFADAPVEILMSQFHFRTSPPQHAHPAIRESRFAELTERVRQHRAKIVNFYPGDESHNIALIWIKAHRQWTWREACFEKRKNCCSSPTAHPRAIEPSRDPQSRFGAGATEALQAALGHQITMKSLACGSGLVDHRSV